MTPLPFKKCLPALVHRGVQSHSLSAANVVSTDRSRSQPPSAWLSRRNFVGGLALAAGATAGAATATEPKRVAAIVTVYHHNSHADVIVSRILQSHSLDGQGTWPPGAGWPKLKVVSLYVDQKHEKDISERLAGHLTEFVHELRGVR